MQISRTRLGWLLASYIYAADGAAWWGAED
jgi:hypothetical protein